MLLVKNSANWLKWIIFAMLLFVLPRHYYFDVSQLFSTKNIKNQRIPIIFAYYLERNCFMNNINDIVDYIISKVKSEDDSASLINLKLQKLLYYIQAWSYGINGKAMFEGEFQAWVHGPVNREIYDRFNPTKYLYSEINLEDRIKTDVKIDEETAEFIDFILENYLKYSGAELERLSHSELPWIQTRGKIGAYDRCEECISEELLISYYGSKWKEINS
ncbi:Uncharacterized phage-associated protein [Mucinivorans hirudinis]|uniref:Uncharacterized phage-associated protein n=1 Tax=Mucinivorans hirudinis TaxID=1433126 RepID=A0A060RD35_9BACT|nr:Uncharacterized phage-associated protein [Mucinivorans hirudinis]